MTEQTPKTATTASTHAAPAAPTAPAAQTKLKPLAAIYQKAEYVCTCGRGMSRNEWVKKRDVASGEDLFTGEVIVSCGYPKCPNHGRKIKVKMTSIEAVEA
jgi:hypothetical protein